MKKIGLLLIVCVILLSAVFAETKKTVAVLEFEGGSKQDCIALADLFATGLANKRVFTVLTRTSVNAIMDEHNFQRTGVTDDKTIKAIGELVNADYIVSGKITALGRLPLLQVQMITVKTGEILSGDDVSFEDIGDTRPYIESMVDMIVGIETVAKTVPKSVVGTGSVSGSSIVNDSTLAMYAGREGIEGIKLLISRGINATDDNGYTALMFASQYGYTELVKELIALGANVNAESYDGSTALAIAVKKGQKWVVKVLRDAGATGIFIGEAGPGGGLVFYIDGDTYLEVSDNLGTGNWNEAKQMAEDYRGGGYDDWYLPSKDELNYIYENLRRKGFIEASGWLWSSSEYNIRSAWNQGFYDGRQRYYGKTNGSNVRAIRAFNY